MNPEEESGNPQADAILSAVMGCAPRNANGVAIIMTEDVTDSMLMVLSLILVKTSISESDQSLEEGCIAIAKKLARKIIVMRSMVDEGMLPLLHPLPMTSTEREQ